MSKKKRYRDHYCKICGEIKSNEKFSGKGHKNHICKSCAKLSQLDKDELMHLREIENVELSGFFLSKANINKLKSYSKNSKYPKVQKYAKQVLDDYNERMEAYKEDKENEERMYENEERMYENEIFEDEAYLVDDDRYSVLESDDELPF